jgi:hypothetical protein
MHICFALVVFSIVLVPIVEREPKEWLFTEKIAAKTDKKTLTFFSIVFYKFGLSLRRAFF